MADSAPIDETRTRNPENTDYCVCLLYQLKPTTGTERHHKNKYSPMLGKIQLEKSYA